VGEFRFIVGHLFVSYPHTKIPDQTVVFSGHEPKKLASAEGVYSFSSASSHTGRKFPVLLLLFSQMPVASPDIFPIFSRNKDHRSHGHRIGERPILQEEDTDEASSD